jgi:hypothetical protein
MAIPPVRELSFLTHRMPAPDRRCRWRQNNIPLNQQFHNVDRVTPGDISNACRDLQMRLKKVDLPTFGRPIMATTGSI